MARRRLKQPQDQEGQAKEQQAANPQEDHHISAAQNICIQEMDAFIRAQNDRRPFTTAQAIPLKRDKPERNQDQTGPEKVIAVLDRFIPPQQVANSIDRVPCAQNPANQIAGFSQITLSTIKLSR
jgi:hypothetical protein